MKKKFNRKKTFFSVICGFVLSLICGFGFMDMKEANALDSSYNIYDYEWANYFNGDALWENCDMVDDFSLSDYPVLRVSNSSQIAKDYIKIGTDIFGSNGCLSKCLPDVVYTLKYNFSFVNVDSSFNAGLGLALHDTTTGSTVDFWGHYYQDYLISVPSGHVIDLYVILNDNTDTELSPIPGFAVINFIELAVYRGTSVTYDYTPYFYSLESLPDDGGSGDSGSGDSGSDTPDLPDDPDSPEVDGSYQEGYLAGLSQAQYGIFSGATYKLVIFEKNVTEASIYTVQPTSIYGGVDFTNVYNDYRQNYPDSNLDSSYILIYLSKPVPFASLKIASYGYRPLFSSDSSNLFGWLLYNGDTLLSSRLGWKIDNPWSSESDLNYFQSIPPNDSSGNVTLLRTGSVSSMSSYNGFKVFMNDNQYSAGFTEGQNSVNTGIYNEGYDDGYSIGFNKGKDEGYTEGFSQGTSTDPYGLTDFMFATLDMPGRIIYNWLNFDFLGINLAGLVATIITLIIVGMVLKLKPF